MADTGYRPTAQAPRAQAPRALAPLLRPSGGGASGSLASVQAAAQRFAAGQQTGQAGINWTPPQQAQPGGGGGWWDNLVSGPVRTVAALGPGLAHLGFQAAKTAGKVGWEAATAPVTIGRVLAGNEDPSALLRPAAALSLPAQIAGAVAPAISEVTGHEPSQLAPFRQALDVTAPVSSEFAQSAARTAGRVTHPSRYGEAWGQGQFFPAALEDVANLSMLAGAGASALRAPIRELPPVAIPEEAVARGPLSYLGEARAAPGPAGVIDEAIPRGLAAGPAVPGGLAGLAPASRAASVLHDVATLGEKAAGGVAKPYEFAVKEGAGRLFKLASGGRPFSQVVEDAARTLTEPRDPNAPRPSGLARATARQAFRITPEGADLRSIIGQSRVEQFDALHQAAEASNLARKIEAKPEETMAAVLIADQRLGPLEGLYRDVGTTDPQVWNRTVHDVFSEVPEYQRPTPGSVKLAIEAKAIREGTPLPDMIGGPTPEQMGRINQVFDAISNVADRQRQAATAGAGWAGNIAGLNPEQLGTEPLSAAAEKLRGPLEAKREPLITKWNRDAERSTRDQRLADAHAAAFAEIRPSVTPSAMFARGKAAGKLVADEARAKTAARAAQSTLTQTVSDYATSVAQGDANVGALAANVDMLTAKVNDALAEVSRAERELQARRGLARVSGETQVTGQEPTPPSIANVAKVGQVRSAVNEAGAAMAERLRAYLDNVMGDSRPRFPAAGQRLEGERDWRTAFSDADRKRLSREGWFEPSTNQNADSIDVWAHKVGQRLGRDTMSVDDAMDWYTKAIHEVWDAEAGRSPEALQTAAERLGLTPQQVGQIHGAGREGVAAVSGELAGRVPEIRQAFDAVTPAEQAHFRQLYETMAAPDFGAVDADFADLIHSFMPQLTERYGPMEALTGRIDMKGLANYLLTDDPRLITAVRAAPTPAILREIGGAQERVRGARGLAAGARRALGRAETAVRTKAAQVYGAAPPSVASALSRAEERVATTGEAAQRAAERSATGQELLRPTQPAAAGTAEATRLPESRALSSSQQLGRLNERARASNAITRGTRRALDHVDADIAAIPEKLRQAFPDRVAQLNDRFVGNARKAARDIEKAGTAAPGISAELNKAIDEILAEHGGTPGARLVIPRVIREVFNSVEGMPDDVRSTLDARFQAWEKARAAMMNRVGDIQFQAAPAPFRPAMTTARSGFKSLMTQADERAAAGDHAGGDILRMYAEDIPSTVEAMDKLGIKPTFLTGGEAPNVAKPTTRLSLNEQKVAAQYKRGPGYGAAALDDVTRRQMQQAKLIVENKTKQLVKQRFGTTVDKLLIGDDINNPHMDPTGMTPEELGRAVEAKGFVPLKGDVVAHDTLVVPEHVANEVGRYDKQMDDNFFYNLLTRVNSGWKTGILALSPRWHLGNIAGNALMATVSGGVSPAELVSRLNAIRKEGGGLKELYKAGGAVEGRPEALLNQGITRTEHELTRARRGVSPKEMGPIGKLAEHSYRANEFADAMFRTAVYDAKLGKGIPSAAALRQTLQAMGDFSNLTHFERTWVRQALPFYPWLRHQTQAILRLPIEHPVRAAWMGHLANMYTDPSMSPTDLRLLGLRTPQSWGPLGGINLSTINPFADPTRMPLTDVTAIGQAVTPALKFPAALGGLDIAKQPPGQFTRPGGKKGWLSPGELAYYAAQQVPFVSTATNLALNPSIARYKTGEPVPSQTGIPTGRGYLSTLMQGLGVPWPDQAITPEKLAAQKARRGG